MAAVKSADADVDGVDRRALTQYLTVLEDVGRVRDVDGQYLVVSESGSEYLVDARLVACECPDYQFRGRECKHLKRLKYSTGEKAIPPIVERDEVDPNLGEHCSGEVRWLDDT